LKKVVSTEGGLSSLLNEGPENVRNIVLRKMQDLNFTQQAP
jgi:hypothetical protein